MLVGLFLLKYIPMEIYGADILFDASGHIVGTCFILYVFYFFIDQNKNWRTPFFIFSFAVLMVISFQRIEANAHNDFGLLLGFLVSIISISIPNWRELKRKINF